MGSTFFVFFGYDNNTPETEKIENILSVIDKKQLKINKITGYTDSYGDSDYNKRLSFKRAKTVANYLPKTDSISGQGVLKNSNNGNLPESKILSRIVLVEVE